MNWSCLINGHDWVPIDDVEYGWICIRKYCNATKPSGYRIGMDMQEKINRAEVKLRWLIESGSLKYRS